MTIKPIDIRPSVLDWRDEMVRLYGDVTTHLTPQTAEMMRDECRLWLKERDRRIDALGGRKGAGLRRSSMRDARAVDALFKTLDEWLTDNARPVRAAVG